MDKINLNKPVLILLLILYNNCLAQNPVQYHSWGIWDEWGSQPDGTYYNPVLPADFSDTDCIRVGDEYYAISSTFQYSPGMVILNSQNLVDWTIIGHAVHDIRQIGTEMNWDKMDRYGRGIWAGSIRHHNGRFYVLFGTPDEGFFTTWAEDPAGPWTPLINILPESGWDDCSAIWDDEGNGYFIGTLFRDRLYKTYIFDMAPDCSSIDRNSAKLVFEGNGREASKLIKVGEWYYLIYSRTGSGARYVVAKRSKEINGVWSEEKQVMAPNVDSNQPNQGGVVEGPDGKWYFLTHHGKGDWEGRSVSLLPVNWIDGWPIIGEVREDGLGYMIWRGKIPLRNSFDKEEKIFDDFNDKILDPNWEWNYYPNNDMWSLSEKPGWLRLRAMKPLQKNNLKKVPNIITQRVYRTKINEVTVKIDLSGMADGQTAGLCHYAATYAYIGVCNTDNGISVIYNENEEVISKNIGRPKTLWLQSAWGLDGLCRFSYSTDGKNYSEFGKPYQFSWGNYRGTRIGLFTFNENQQDGYVDIDYFKYRKK
ncbi:MAG: glycoside hydrolase 43 family protein [Rikenellaceae bacterium]|nr:glycoside hydrolase 43 family protein [Rikenellaceae bacterium]